ncbi:integral membrane protein [Enterococcus asini ATCC 700915]|uniref:Integral membrane protein n=1 Tax=Enterococcus asini ATCC 700915 TaxID=1158606 RepID=R2RRM6_9ENTE|nr:TIGR01906 family membrane protein [Enterococcus asini]EOH86035.1 integral membrane protein [Enterococcus asini ATCC 700915]EOT57808.1 integral membrane protein [Enterococcus asini ATCC 700915]
MSRRDKGAISQKARPLNSKKQRVLAIFGLVSLFLFLLTLAITITINFRPLYRFSIQRFDLLTISGLDQGTLLKNFDQLMDFLNKPWITSMNLPDFPMSAAGYGHFVDVKYLFLLNYAVLLVTVIPAVAYLLYLKRNGRLWQLVRPFQWGMGVPVILGFLMAIGFDTFFVKFHELFFSNYDWLFDPATDPIINVLPEGFFMYCFILAFVLLELFFFSMVLVGRRSLRK